MTAATTVRSSWTEYPRPRARLSRPGNRHRSDFVIFGCNAAERAAAERVNIAFGGTGERDESRTWHERGRWVQYVAAAVTLVHGTRRASAHVRCGSRNDICAVSARHIPYRQRCLRWDSGPVAR